MTGTTETETKEPAKRLGVATQSMITGGLDKFFETIGNSVAFLTPFRYSQANQAILPNESRFTRFFRRIKSQPITTPIRALGGFVLEMIKNPIELAAIAAYKAAVMLPMHTVLAVRENILVGYNKLKEQQESDPIKRAEYHNQVNAHMSTLKDHAYEAGIAAGTVLLAAGAGIFIAGTAGVGVAAFGVAGPLLAPVIHAGHAVGVGLVHAGDSIEKTGIEVGHAIKHGLEGPAVQQAIGQLVKDSAIITASVVGGVTGGLLGAAAMRGRGAAAKVQVVNAAQAPVVNAAQVQVVDAAAQAQPIDDTHKVARTSVNALADHPGVIEDGHHASSPQTSPTKVAHDTSINV